MPQNNTSSSSLLARLTTSTRSSFLSPKDVRCNVHLLHDSDIIGNEFGRTQSAQTVLDYVCELKHIQEKDFLGLRYQDHNKHRYWLDLTRSIGHVVKHFRIPAETMTLHLRFRYYPSDPARLRDPNLRYQLFVQLQRDLLHGRLYCPATSAAELAALILQTQLGDYDEQKHQGNYVSGYKLLLKQTPKLEERIAAIHAELRGKSSADAELEFLEKASQLDTYAFDPYTIKDAADSSNAVYLGASCKGILIYAGQSRTHHIEWSELAKVDYSGREIRLSLTDDYRGSPTLKAANGTSSAAAAADRQQHTKKPLTLKYQCPSAQFAKHLWIHILSQQAFFNEEHAQDVKLKFSKPRIPLLSRGSTFRFPSKRVYREIEEEDARSMRFERSFMDGGAEGGGALNDTILTNETAEEHTDEEHPNGDLNISSISVPTVISSSSSSVVVRYELPRQTPRAEQPWLARNGKVVNGIVAESEEPSSSASTPGTENNQNNNLSKLTNLNVSLENAEKPSEVPKIVLTQQFADHNSTSFTVHLVKREEIAAARTSSDFHSGAAASAPPSQMDEFGGSRAQVLEHKFNELVAQDVESIGRPLASSTPRSVKQIVFEKNGNGKVANGGVSSNEKKLFETNGHTICTEEKQESLVDDTTSSTSSGTSSSTSTSSSNSTGLVQKAANTFFGAFLVLLLTLAVIIVLFERSDGSAHSDFIESHGQLRDLRHVYYEPARHYVVDQYRKYFGAKL